jgi:EAL domain-containing protein (putative c-di-GMP-specific phosphodiesterase class I)
MPTDLRNLTYPPGAVIYSEGEAGACAYLVVSGRIRLTALHDGREEEVATLGKGDLIGESSLINDQPRTTTARAVETSVLIPVPRDHLHSKLKNTDALVRLLLKVLLLRLGRPGGPRATGPRPADGQDSQRDLEGAVGESTQRLVLSELSLINALRSALEKGDLEVHYQPIVRLRDGEVAGFEALVRWRRADGTPVSPGQFIPAAEEGGLIVPIGAWVLRKATEDLARLVAAHRERFPLDPSPFMSINVSGRQLYSTRAVADLADTLRGCGVDPALIKLEMTESVLMTDPEAANRALRLLKETGVRIAVDDFGTGYSSLGYLQRFPVDVLKIDQSFVRTMLSSGSSGKIVRAVVRLARELGLESVAEGVEESAQLDQLRGLDCTFAQGFLFARPAPLDQAMETVEGRGAVVGGGALYATGG